MTSILKKPKSNFLIFCDEKRPIIKAKFPTMKVTDVTIEMAKQWEALTKEQKDVYTKKYEQEKELYAARLLEQQEAPASKEVSDAAPAIKEKGSKAKKASKKDDKPVEKKKAVANGYINFCSSVRARVKSENTDLGPKDIMKKIGEMWNGLSLEEKKVHNSKAISDLEQQQSASTSKVSVQEPLVGTSGSKDAKDKAVKEVEEKKELAVEAKQEKAAEPVKKTRKPRKVSAEPELA